MSIYDYSMYRTSTPQALALKEKLEGQGIVVQAEKWDGYKHIDLTIHRAKLNIEVDGMQHYENPDQILSDLTRSHYSDLKGWDTIHVPNTLLELHLDSIALAIANAAKIRAKKSGHRFHFHHQ
jgi:very-short-patch-repair endonuclease